MSGERCVWKLMVTQAKALRRNRFSWVYFLKGGRGLRGRGLGEGH